jgi:hypothetical protein
VAAAVAARADAEAGAELAEEARTPTSLSLNLKP